jgi:uncharacterized FAD-dependent dehydrogenase
MRPVLMGRGVDIQHKVNYQNLQKLQVMTLQEALIVLAKHQQWRLGAEIEMAEPKVITMALDVVLAYHHVGINEMIQDKEKIKIAKDRNKIGIRWEEYQDWLNEVPELSDEEIEKFADEELGTIRTDFDFGFIQGMKWYRAQVSSQADKKQ